MAVLPFGCLPAEPSDGDDAQEAVVRHFAERIDDGPWKGICLSRNTGAGQESQASYFRRFEGHRLPVVSARHCAAAGEENFDWIVVETGKSAIKIFLGEARRNVDGRLLVPAGTSTGTLDYTEYHCTLVQAGPPPSERPEFPPPVRCAGPRQRAAFR